MRNSHLFELSNSCCTNWIIRMVDNILCSDLQLGSLHQNQQLHESVKLNNKVCNTAKVKCSYMTSREFCWYQWYVIYSNSFRISNGVISGWYCWFDIRKATRLSVISMPITGWSSKLLNLNSYQSSKCTGAVSGWHNQNMEKQQLERKKLKDLIQEQDIMQADSRNQEFMLEMYMKNLPRFSPWLPPTVEETECG